jgi:hypothetical protein
MGGSSLPEAYALAFERQEEAETYARLRESVRDRMESIVGICARLKSAAERSDTAFLDQGDFVKQVRSDTAEVTEHLTWLSENI